MKECPERVGLAGMVGSGWMEGRACCVSINKGAFQYQCDGSIVVKQP